jgi:hypothetical protein
MAVGAEGVGSEYVDLADRLAAQAQHRQGEADLLDRHRGSLAAGSKGELHIALDEAKGGP